MIQKNEQLWEFCNKIYKNGTSYKDDITTNMKFWEGKLDKTAPVNNLFPKEEKTPFNIIKPIIETKLKAMLDAQFSISVLPKVKSFNNYEEVKNQNIIADILDAEIKNIFKQNNIDTEKEEIGRYGFIAGYGAAKVSFNTEDDPKGYICIEHIDSRNLKWDKNAIGIDNNTFFAYEIHQSPSKVKDSYCRNDDGSYDLEKCEMVDKITKSDTKDRKNWKDIDEGRVINYENTYGSGQAYVSQTKGLQTNKTVDLIVMFLIDDSFYSPDKEDDEKEKQEKEIYLRKYPNGRMIIFSENEKEKIIFEDRELPKSFNSLGNIVIFNPIKWNGIKGYSEITDLIPIQNRITGSLLKSRLCIANDVSVIAVNKDCGIKESSFVNFPVVFMEKLDQATVLSNNGIDKALQILNLVDAMKNNAYEMCRVNETMMYGSRQTGTTSADQVESLQESPMTEIRSYQRNFKDFVIDIAKKCLNLILENYNFGRMITLIDYNKKYSYAEIKVPVNSMTGEEAKVIQLYDKNGQQVRSIQFNPEWEFDIEVTAGTEVPRTRRENAQLMDKLLAQGVLQQIQDIDLLEIYLRSQDLPNYRAIIGLLRDKKEQEKQYADTPESKNWKEVIKNPIISKSFADFFKAIDGYSKAKQQILLEVGLVPNPAKLDDTPVTETTSQSDVAEVVTMAPSIISDNPMNTEIGMNAAKAEQVKDVLVGGRRNGS